TARGRAPRWGGVSSVAGVVPGRTGAAAGLGFAATSANRRRAAVPGGARTVGDRGGVGHAGEHGYESSSAINRRVACPSADAGTIMNFEDELRRAFIRQPAPPDVADRVLARIR